MQLVEQAVLVEYITAEQSPTCSVDPTIGAVIVKLSTWPEPDSADLGQMQNQLLLDVNTALDHLLAIPNAKV